MKKIEKVFVALLLMIISSFINQLMVLEIIDYPQLLPLLLLHAVFILSSLYILINGKFLISLLNETTEDKEILNEAEETKLQINLITAEIKEIAKGKGIDEERLKFHCIRSSNGKVLTELTLSELIHFRSYILGINYIIQPEDRDTQVYGILNQQ
jgi:hypothetical protein